MPCQLLSSALTAASSPVTGWPGFRIPGPCNEDVTTGQADWRHGLRHAAGWRSSGGNAYRTSGAAEPDQLIATLTMARRQAPGSVHQPGQAPPGHPLAGVPPISVS